MPPAPGAALDPSGRSREFAPVEKQTVKTIGTLQKTPWQRFTRLQRTAAQLARGRGQPKGAFRFVSSNSVAMVPIAKRYTNSHLSPAWSPAWPMTMFRPPPLSH